MTTVLEHEAPVESALAIPLDQSLEAHEPPEARGRERRLAMPAAVATAPAAVAPTVPAATSSRAAARPAWLRRGRGS